MAAQGRAGLRASYPNEHVAIQVTPATPAASRSTSLPTPMTPSHDAYFMPSTSPRSSDPSSSTDASGLSLVQGLQRALSVHAAKLGMLVFLCCLCLLTHHHCCCCSCRRFTNYTRSCIWFTCFHSWYDF
jgi:hypothetical protein